MLCIQPMASNKGILFIHYVKIQKALENTDMLCFQVTFNSDLKVRCYKLTELWNIEARDNVRGQLAT